MNLKRKLFWDLDETMVHTLVADSEKHADQLIDMYGEHWKGTKIKVRYDGWYVTFLRNSTHRLLEFSRELLGEDNVYILSVGSLDYVLWVNVLVGLGFDPNTHIYGREDIAGMEINKKFSETFNVLIDNENYEYQSMGERCKVKYLNNIPPEQFIQILPFTVWSEKIDPLEIDNLVDDVKVKIKTAFKL